MGRQEETMEYSTEKVLFLAITKKNLVRSQPN